MGKVFVDTNILIYSMDRHDPTKQSRCRFLLRDLWQHDAGVISTQVMQEFYVTATKKLDADPLVVKNILHSFSHFEIVVISPEIIHDAVDISILNTLSFWDALIISAAALARCGRVWTEDMNSGQRVRNVRIENPL